MKKLLALGLALSMSTAMAGPYYGRPYYGHGGNWLVPAIIGGFLGYGLSRSQQPQTVIIQEPAPRPSVVYQLPPAPDGYHYVQLYDQACGCYRQVLMQNQ